MPIAINTMASEALPPLEFESNPIQDAATFDPNGEFDESVFPEVKNICCSE